MRKIFQCTRKRKDEENCTKRSFIICAPHQGYQIKKNKMGKASSTHGIHKKLKKKLFNQKT
jgi:hypothetical protein